MKTIKILSIEKKQRSKKYKVITDELDYTVNVKQLHFEAETEALVDYIY